MGDLLDLLFLNLQKAVPIGLFRDFNVGLRLALFVFEGAVQEHDAGVLDASTHFGMGDVFVEHDTVEHLAVLNFATGDLFDASVALDVDLASTVFFLANSANGFESQGAHEVGPAGGKLGANGSFNEAEHLLLVVDVHWDTNAVDYT